MRIAASLCAGLGLVACGSSDAAPPSVDAGVTDASVLDAYVDPPMGDGGGVDAHGLSDAVDAPDTPPPPVLQYKNPVLNQDFPDPYILLEGTTYYAFATNANSKNIQTSTSNDLATWGAVGDALPALPGWAAKNAGLTWAPSVLKRGASFVMYYTARDVASGFQCVSRAVATQPQGPYVDNSSAPFICQVSLCGSIDPSPFVDADGTAYLLWKSDENAAACSNPPRLWSAGLAADGLSLSGTPSAILTMDEDWEKPIIEGPSMILHDGIYVLLYSANNYESAAYSMGYATCLLPNAACKKATTTGPFIKSAGSALGPGGGEFLTDASGRTWLAYHAWTAPNTTYGSGGARSLRIDPLSFVSGVPVLAGPTTTVQTIP